LFIECNSSRGFYGFGDDYSAKLFDQYIKKGGDAEALQVCFCNKFVKKYR